MKTVTWGDLPTSDLVVDACYQGQRKGNAGDDPLNRLVGVSNQGGFRILGSVESPRLVVILTGAFDPDWPDTLDHESGVFTYFGDNKNPGTRLHDTERWGNRLLRFLFGRTHGGLKGRQSVPPILVFSRTGQWRDVIFRGLAVPGADGISQIDDLVAVWKTKSGERFQNYRALFTILDAPVVSRAWLQAINRGEPLSDTVPEAFRVWTSRGAYKALQAKRVLNIRGAQAQLPNDERRKALLAFIRDRYRPNPHAFENFAAQIARLHLKSVSAIDVTRPTRDGGRDAIGLFRVGSGESSITIDFALEAKCYDEKNSVGVREMSRLISRLRHRQFGVMVTTSYVHAQAYKEIKEDEHPILIMSGGDIVDVLVQHGISTREALAAWIEKEVGSE